MTYTLTGRYPLGSLEGRPGQLRFVPSTTIVGADNIILPAPVLVDLDTDGSFSVDLVGTDDAAYAPSGWVWTVEERLDGGRPAWSFELTADSDLSELASTSPPGSYVTLVPTSRTMTAGAGLYGGGTLAADRTWNVGAGVGIIVNADDVAIDPSVVATQADLAGLAADTTNVHGIADTAALETTGHAAKHAAAGSDAVTVAESQVTGLTAALAAKIPAATLDAQSLLYAVTDNTPAALAVAASRFVGRKASGDLGAMTVAEAKALLALAVADITGAAPTASPTFTGTVTVPTPAAGSATTVAASTLWAVERATVGNLLTANQASGTDALGTTEGFRAAIVCTIESVLVNPYQGTRSLAQTTTGTGLALVSTGPASGFAGVPIVSPGSAVTLHAKVRSSVGGENLRLDAYWLRADGSASATVYSSTGVVASSATAHVTIRGTLNVPSDARMCVVVAARTVGAIGSIHYWDALGLWAGAGGEWAMPGTPITNLGTRVRHPSGDDVVIEVWDSSIATPAWATVRQDTGRRGLTLANSWTATTAELRRVGPRVELVLFGLNGASATSGTVVTLDAGFRPSSARTFTIGTTAAGLPAHVVTVNTNGTVVVGGTYTAVTAGSLTAACNTDAAWPATLPGSTVAAAPA